MTRTTLLALSIALAMPAFAQSVDDVGGVASQARAAKKAPFWAGDSTKAILAGAGSFTGAEAVMSPRFFRSGVVGDPACATFSAGNFQYQEFPFNTDGTGSLTATVANGTCGVNMFVTFHDGAFNPGSICDNYHWTFGSSSDFSETFAVPPNSPMVMVVSGVANAPGVVCDFTYSLDGVGGTGVQLTNPASNSPRLIAEELIIPPARTFTNNGSLDISTAVEYSFSPGEVRYARFHCPGMEFEAGTSVTYSGDVSNLIGAVNGIGSDAIYFSITAGATPVIAADTLIVDGDRTLTTKAPIDCTYGLYDFPSQAQAGGATGRVATTSGAYVRFGPSYALVVDEQGNPIADVESNDPAYSEFEVGAPTFSELLGNVGGFSYGTVQQVAGTDQPITIDGNAIELTDLMAAGTSLVFAGDFEAAGDVFFSPGVDCSINIQSADSFDDTEAVFTIGANPAMDHYLCYEVNGVPVRATPVTVALAPLSAAPAVYAVGGRGPLALGEITRNGTELQAPLAQLPGGWLSRLVLTNRGTQDREYQIEVLGETGNTISTSNLTGTVDAESTLVVDLGTVLTGFTGLPRATLNVTVAAPNNTIQGLYQIVNPDSGSISNHVMVRPGSN